MSVRYETIFDARDTLGHAALPAVLGVALVVAGLVTLHVGSQRPKRWHLVWSGASIALFAAVWTMIAFLGPVRGNRALAAALASGRYDVGEGIVHDYQPMPRNRTGVHESFAVGAHEYRVSNYDESTGGFNRTALNGSPIRDGARVRIADIGGVIARLELVSGPTPESR